MYSLCKVLFIILTSQVYASPRKKSYLEIKSCNIGHLAEEIASYDSVVRDIMDYVVSGPFKRKTYDELEKFVDKFGSRISGSQVLEDSIDYMIKLTQDEDFNDIVTEELEVPYWVREQEKITMLKPRPKNIAVLGLGKSISTPPEASYRKHGAARAAKKGAVASLVRSITPFSINSPHTGIQYYSDNVTKIPTAAITLEDADLINRFVTDNEQCNLESW
ncbi:carboxypeptidase Q [Pieris rapae]|uniref:carboxypeptidase Q n=1 Tax=Pieris rapae TaxID=64459 RepID=UPI001E281A48|nr:carboxypeptidase Q [Pieris rapae]